MPRLRLNLFSSLLDFTCVGVSPSPAMFNGKGLRMTDRWSLSSDGGTLTLSQRHQFGTEPEAEDVIVLDRKPAASWEPDQAPKPAEEVYKNIQIMKGMPAPRLQLVMTNLTKWIGVDCAYCHVPGEFEKDARIAGLPACLWNTGGGRSMARLLRV